MPDSSSVGFDFVGFVGHGGGHGHGGGRRGGGGWWSDDGGLEVLDAESDYDLDDVADAVAQRINSRTLVGMFDFNVEQPKMNSLKQVTVGIAQSLLAAGQSAINGAIAGAKQPWYTSDLPGTNSRNLVASKLVWHVNTLAPLAGTPNAIYASGDDLKQVVLSAFREANAVEAGAAYLQTAWDAMWKEIQTKIAALPKEIATVVNQVLPAFMKWGIGIGAGVLVLVGGFVAYKKLT